MTNLQALGFSPSRLMINVREDDRRQIKAANLKTIADLMQAIGLLTPITVAVFNPVLSWLRCAIGWQPAKRLGLETIDCFLLPDDADDRDAELAEIAENLHRADLTALERDEQIALGQGVTRKSQTPVN